MKNQKLYWVITNNCNLTCRHCYYNTGLEKRIIGNLDFSKALELIDDFPKHFKEIVFTGGETLLYQHIFELAQYCKNKKLRVSVFTNGVLLNKINSKKLVDIGIDSISISLDSLSSEMNDYQRGRTDL